MRSLVFRVLAGLLAVGFIWLLFAADLSAWSRKQLAGHCAITVLFAVFAVFGTAPAERLLCWVVGKRRMTAQRLGYDDSIRRLQELGLLGSDQHPPMPDLVPQSEDEESLGLSFFRTFVGEGADLSNLTIPRTFFGRSEVSNALFRNTDLSESNLRWNDFIDVDFTQAILTRADFRASNYTRVNFERADLRGADMRRADFEECIFDGAAMDGALLTRNQESRLSLSSVQKAAIGWCNDDGPEPSGG